MVPNSTLFPDGDLIYGAVQMKGLVYDVFETKTDFCSHSLVCSKNSLLIVGLGPILDKEL